MRLSLVLIFLAPLLEIASFIIVGRTIGVFPTLGLVLLSAVLGLVLLRMQGAGILRRLQTEAQRGVDPGRELAHGALLVVAAFLLIVPGFFGDVLGLLLFIPLVRDLAWRLIKPKIVVQGSFAQSGFQNRSSTAADIVDLDDDEFRREPNQDSPWRDPRLKDH
jgi:UPF0716 protein FxsA